MILYIIDIVIDIMILWIEVINYSDDMILLLWPYCDNIVLIQLVTIDPMTNDVIDGG